jgi:hypothetical protein
LERQKETENFYQVGFGLAGEAQSNSPKFFGSFFQKRTACLAPAHNVLDSTVNAS